MVPILGGKGYARERAKNVLGVFEFDVFLSCIFGSSKKGGWGEVGRTPPKR